MKRIGLLAIIGCSVSGVAIAASVDCNVIPTCAEMGFDKTVAECGESKVLRCPFDLTNDDAVYCAEGNTKCDALFTLDSCPANGVCAECNGKYLLYSCDNNYSRGNNICCSDEYYNLTSAPANATVEQCGNKYHLVTCNEGYSLSNNTCKNNCKIGSLLYNNLKCYDNIQTDKTAIAVVFDATNKIAIELNQNTNGFKWGGQGTDISTMKNYTSSAEALADSTSGKINTSRIVASLGNSSDYAAGYCNNLTTGGFSKGSWYLPSLKELNTLFLNKTTVGDSITTAGGKELGWMWSSTEHSSSYAWRYRINYENVNTFPKDTSYYYVRCAISY